MNKPLQTVEAASIANQAMYRLLIKRVRNNPLTGGVQYKVAGIRVVLSSEQKQNNISSYPDQRIFFMPSSKPYRVGTFINPRKALGI